jgi:hypothetical protein
MFSENIRRGGKLMKVLGMILFLVGMAGILSASVPEIDPGSAGSAVALLTGTLLVLKSRRKS